MGASALCSYGRENPPADLTEGGDTAKGEPAAVTSAVTDTAASETPPTTTWKGPWSALDAEDILRAYPFESFMPDGGLWP